ncbi:MAG TPA: hypothetical protein VK277_10545 [Acidimicrobiales bacterium]|nr:hypothetical protein [Acidimicrobiales bacterium]
MRFAGEDPHRWATGPVATLPDPAGTAPDFFGSPALSGHTLVVGDAIAQPAGAAYVYMSNGLSWPSSPTATLTPPSDLSVSGFGSSVALSGRSLIVGASGAPVLPGSAFVYHL